VIEIFIKSFIIAFSGALMPGSLLTYTIDKSIKNGRYTGLIISLGHSILEFILVFLLLFGFSRILSHNISQIIIGFTGGIVMIFFGISMIKDAADNKIILNINNENSSNISTKKRKLFFNGALISAINPYFIIWWTAVGLSLITNSFRLFGFTGVIIFYIGHIIADISWYTFVSFAVYKTRNFLNIKVYKIIIVLLAVCLMGFGTSFIINSIKIIIS
jgi:threonine/homoserine/homoserine lactone efflux protein